uniref:Tubulin--tyrosine ligase-like protein 5 n=1 Tax=Noctiluca scintillans TaxID=2966 RepID=A0A7S1EX81_NOCSC|mmetsp:Transcript_14558/g.39993  ORF Transcript_14558/g.39993 Transcript_14558/m.39993 type:complete len:407 (+) Transcript_14558:20-1240(+)
MAQFSCLFLGALFLRVGAAACADGETCLVDDRPLRWRRHPYNEKPPQRTYGGEFVEQAFRSRFQGPVSDDHWDVFWHKDLQVEHIVRHELPARPGRLVNYCGYFKGAGQKCYFCGHSRRVQAALENNASRASRFTHLRTFMLKDPKQFAQWAQEVRADPSKPWVFKPCSAGMSTGIELLQGDRLLAAVGRPSEKWSVAQEYLHPYMGFGSSKFHLRMYLLVTRWGPPASAFIFDEGIVFRSRQQYNPGALTEDRDVFSAASSEVEALPHAALWTVLDDAAQSTGLPDSSAVREHIFDVVRELFSVSLEESFGDREKLHGRGFGCFDLFGLDVMLDETLTPYVLEINTGPNMEISDRGEENTSLLRRVKGVLIEQLLHWAELHVRQPETLDAERIEGESLQNFTRIL